MCDVKALVEVFASTRDHDFWSEYEVNDVLLSDEAIFFQNGWRVEITVRFRNYDLLLIFAKELYEHSIEYGRRYIEYELNKNKKHYEKLEAFIKSLEGGSK